MKKNIISMSLALIMSTVLLTGCGGDKSNSSGNNQNGNTMEEKLADKQELQLHWAANNFHSFDGNAFYATEEIQLLSQVNEGLVRSWTDEEGNQSILPAGAESWTTSDDELVWTFKLRDYKWTDGVEVTAQQYVDSFRRLGDPRNSFDFAIFLDDIVGGEALYTMDAEASEADIKAAQEKLGVKAIDDKTLEITLEKPSTSLLSKLSNIAMYPIRLDVIEKAGETYATDYKQHVFCGPFKIVDYVKDNSATLEKNADYWDAENVKLTKVSLVNIAETSTQNTMFKNKDLAAILPTGDYVDPYREGQENGEYTFYQKPTPTMDFFYFNRETKSPSGIIESPKVRLALSLAIDREEFTELIFNRYYPAYGFVPNGVQIGERSYRDNVEEPFKKVFDEYAMDDAKLQALFKEGMADLGVNKELKDVTLTYITTGTTPIKKQQQEYWKQAWEKKLGINVNVNVLGDSSLFREEREAGRYDISYSGWTGDYNDPMAFLSIWASNGIATKYNGWNPELGKKVDEMLAKLENESEPEKREAIYAEIENWLVNEEVAVVPVAYRDNLLCVNNNVKNMKLPVFGPVFEFSRAYIVE